jgi:glycosyltransferase involved in cell wall biosynthesis
MFKPGTGGLQAHAEHLCRHLQHRGHEVVLVTRAYTRVPHFRDYLFFNEPACDTAVNGVCVRPLRFSTAWRPAQWFLSKCVPRPPLQPLGVWIYRLQARRQARAAFAGFDLIHHVGQATALIGFAAADAARYHRIPFLVQPTCHPHQIGDSPLDLRLYAQADRLLVHTRYEGDYLRRNGLTMPIDVVGNGIEDRSDGQSERFRAQFGVKGPIILYIGRKDPDKGYPLLVEAFTQVRQRRPDISLVCMGPPGDTRLVQKVEGLVDIDFASEEMKHDALAACSCLCVPSIGESFGLVYMEAGRYAKPVIARRLPVLEELLDGGSAGLLLGTPDPQSNSATLKAQELASGLLKLLSSPEDCRRLGENCRQASDSFIWPAVIRRFERAYFAAIGPVPSAGELSSHLHV